MADSAGDDGDALARQWVAVAGLDKPVCATVAENDGATDAGGPAADYGNDDDDGGEIGSSVGPAVAFDDESVDVLWKSEFNWDDDDAHARWPVSASDDGRISTDKSDVDSDDESVYARESVFVADDASAGARNASAAAASADESNHAIEPLSVFDDAGISTGKLDAPSDDASATARQLYTPPDDHRSQPASRNSAPLARQRVPRERTFISTAGTIHTRKSNAKLNDPIAFPDRTQAAQQNHRSTQAPHLSTPVGHPPEPPAAE